MELGVLVAAGRHAIQQVKIAKLPWSRMHFAVDRTGPRAWNYMKTDEIAKLLSLLRHGGQGHHRSVAISDP